MSVKFRYYPTLFPPMTEVSNVSKLKEEILKITDKISKNDIGKEKMIIFLRELKPLVTNIDLMEIFPKISNQDFFLLTIYHLKYGLLRLWKNLFQDSPFEAEEYEFFKDFLDNLVVFIDLSLKSTNNNDYYEKLVFSLNNLILLLYDLFNKKNGKEIEKYDWIKL